MKINSDLNVDDLPGVMHRQITGRQILFGVLAVVAGVVILLVLNRVFHVPANYGCYAALPVVFVIVFFGAVNFHGYSGFDWLLKQQDIRAGRRIYYYDAGEETQLQNRENGGKEADN